MVPPDIEPPRDLDADELTYLRKMIEDDKRAMWFWARIRRWASAALIGTASLVAFRDDVSDLIKWLLTRGE